MCTQAIHLPPFLPAPGQSQSPPARPHFLHIHRQQWPLGIYVLSHDLFKTWGPIDEIARRFALRGTILTHCGRVTHICVNKLTNAGPDNGLAPGRRQAIIRTNAEILLNRTFGTNFNEITIKIHILHTWQYICSIIWFFNRTTADYIYGKCNSRVPGQKEALLQM